MGRPRTRLIGALACLLILTACGTTEPGKLDTTTATATTTTTADVRPSGYSLPQGKRTELYTGKTGTVSVSVGDVLVVQRTREVRQRPDAAVLILAESRDDGKLVFQAVAPGRVSLYTDDPHRAPCSSTPCPPSASAPTSVTIEVK
jgi:ABC-type glycerol-3-phosphate transport system substrate-binding protein